MNSWYLIAAILVGLVFPGYAMWSGRKLKEILKADPGLKIAMFKSTAVLLIALAVISMMPLWINGVPLKEIGLGFVSDPLALGGLLIFPFLTVGGLLVIPLMALWLMWQMNVTEESARSIHSQYSEVAHIMPESKRVYRLTIGISFVAGICEEIVYRGFLLWFLAVHMPLVPAVILANLPFALGHLTTTGWKNTSQAYLLALVFTAAFLLTKSLWLPILLHILVDLYSMTIYYRGSKVRAESDEMGI